MSKNEKQIKKRNYEEFLKYFFVKSNKIYYYNMKLVPNMAKAGVSKLEES